MDTFQFIFGIIFLIAGASQLYKNRDTKKIILGIILLIIGLSLSYAGIGGGI